MGLTGNPVLSTHNVVMTLLLNQEPRLSGVIIAFLLRYVHGGFETQFDQLVNFGETSIYDRFHFNEYTRQSPVWLVLNTCIP